MTPVKMAGSVTHLEKRAGGQVFRPDPVFGTPVNSGSGLKT
jgi:hypothetical protein